MITQRLLDEYQMFAVQQADKMLNETQRMYLGERAPEPVEETEMELPETAGMNAKENYSNRQVR